MPEPSLAPFNRFPTTEPNRSSQPVQAAGLHHEQRAPDHETLLVGRVDDAYGAAGGYLVSVANHKQNFPCFALAPADGRPFGASDFAPLPIGTQVMVHCPRDLKYGIILGVVPTVEDPPHGRPAHQLVPEGGVNQFSDAEAFFPPDWRVAGLLPEAGGSGPVDALPGDAGRLNEWGVGSVIQRLMVSVKAGELAGMEAHVLEDLLRLIGHRLETFHGVGEERVDVDYGRLCLERHYALTQAEAMGVEGAGQDTSEENPGVTLSKKPREIGLRPRKKGATLRARWTESFGTLGDLFQRWLVKPSRAPRALDGGDYPADVGLRHEWTARSGQRLDRSLVGGGIFKAVGIAVPRRLRANHDPEGDGRIEPGERKPFRIDPSERGAGHPAGLPAMTRDYLAWQFDHAAKDARAELKKDWKTPDEADAKLPPGAEPRRPGLGGYFCDAAPVVDALAAAGDSAGEEDGAQGQFRPGNAWVSVLPDGGIQGVDAWGAEIRTGYGHIDLSAPKDVKVTAGGSFIVQAADDIVLRARQAVDVSSTKNQVRIKGDRDLLLSTQKGGILLDAPTPGGKNEDYSSDDAKGEKMSVSGITLSTGGTITGSARTADFALESYFYVGGRREGQHPDLYFRGGQELHWLDGTAAWLNGEGAGVEFNGGSVYATGTLQNDGDLNVRGGAACGSGFPPGPADFSKVKPIIEALAPAFEAGTWEKFQSPYTFKDLKDIGFSFRSTSECAAGDLRFYPAAWQVQIGGLASWAETSVNNTFPYPGKDHYNGGLARFYRYEEVNVEPSGKPRARDAQDPAGGRFSPVSFNDFLTHPER